MAGDELERASEEVEGEPAALERFVRAELPRASGRAVFVGAGDSYAAALAGFHASKGRHVAVDPYVLASEPDLARGAEVFFISVSGRTASNILAAERVGGQAKSITALTAVQDSRLAELADRVVRLPVPYARRTPGILSFSLSLMAVLRIAGAAGGCNPTRAFTEAQKGRLRFAPGEGTTYLLGNSLAYPAALYAAAKVYEILGARAHAEYLEEFSHLQLFSLRKSDAVNILSSFDPSGISGRLGRALTEKGYRCRVVKSWGRSPLERVIHAVFMAQLSVLQEARARGLRAPRFLLSQALGASDEMIY